MGVPGSDKGGACQPATDGQIGRWEKKDAGPADKNEAVALEPVIEDVEPSPLWRASYSDRHRENGADDPQAVGYRATLTILNGLVGGVFIT